jgi:hypothetical protein
MLPVNPLSLTIRSRLLGKRASRPSLLLRQDPERRRRRTNATTRQAILMCVDFSSTVGLKAKLS